MRLHRVPGPAIWGLPVCRYNRGFEYRSLTDTPVKEETGLSPWV